MINVIKMRNHANKQPNRPSWIPRRRYVIHESERIKNRTIRGKLLGEVAVVH